MKTVADQFAEILAAAGVKRIYGIVGDSLNGVTDGRDTPSGQDRVGACAPRRGRSLRGGRRGASDRRACRRWRQLRTRQFASHQRLIRSERLKAPMVHAMRGKEHVEGENPYDVGMTDLIGFSSGYYAMLDCDVLLILAVVLTATSFWVANTSLLWGPGVPLGLVVLAIGQMGVHLVFFLHITTGPDNTNNVLALAFGVLIVTLVIGGSVWIMANLNANMMPSPELMNLQMQH
jgi:cytochrome o ubiquinol oxidase subunit IV